MFSVDTKKKELVGDFKNAGREWQPKGEPVAVRVHDSFFERNGAITSSVRTAKHLGLDLAIIQTREHSHLKDSHDKGEDQIQF